MEEHHTCSVSDFVCDYRCENKKCLSMKYRDGSTVNTFCWSTPLQIG
jgi:hypothetical protein